MSTKYYIIYPIPYSTRCDYNSTETIYVLQNPPETNSPLIGKYDTLVKKRFYDCDEIIYPIKNPNSSGILPYFKINETSTLLTYISSLGLTLDKDITTLTRSQYKHAYVFYSS